MTRLALVAWAGLLRWHAIFIPHQLEVSTIRLHLDMTSNQAMHLSLNEARAWSFEPARHGRVRTAA
jgi:hypothetical protein